MTNTRFVTDSGSLEEARSWAHETNLRMSEFSWATIDFVLRTSRKYAFVCAIPIDVEVSSFSRSAPVFVSRDHSMVIAFGDGGWEVVV